MKFKGSVIFVALGMLGLAETKDEATKRIREAGVVFEEIMSTPDKGIPQDLLEKAHCIGIIPGLKRAGFIVGGNYGKGIVTCRTKTGWSAPSTVRVEGGSVGFQIGAGETDLVFVVMNESGAKKLAASQFTVGGEAAAMAGPVGRQATAQTDALMRAEILSYSRSRGVFAGVALNGSTLRPDDESNSLIFGKSVDHAEILGGKVKSPDLAQPLFSAINKYAPIRRAAVH